MSGETLKLLLIGAGWYGTSVVATNSSKVLLKAGISGFCTTFIQLVVSYLLCTLYVNIFGPKTVKGMKNAGDYQKVAFAYTMGFVTLNLGMSVMQIPLAMTLRAGEPIVAFIVGKTILPNKPSNTLGLALIPIAIGCGLCAATSLDFSPFGFALLMLANLSFTCRSMFGKHVQTSYGTSGVELFQQVCFWGMLFQFPLWMVSLYFKGLEPDLTPHLPYLLLNGACVWAYLTGSFLMLSRVNPITHTVLNTMRRPVIIIISTLYFKVPLSTPAKFGIAIACLGTLLYAKVKSSESKATKKKT